MKPAKDFDIVFIHEDGSQELAKDWEERVIKGYTYYQTRCGELDISVMYRNGEELYLKTHNKTQSNITGFIGIRFSWEEQEKGYTVVPGIFYNGNYQERLQTIPFIKLPEHPVFQASLSAASVPAVFVWDGGQTAHHYAPSIDSAAGWNGVEFDAANKTMTFYAPAREDLVYHLAEFYGSRLPHTWRPNKTLSMKVRIKAFAAASVREVYDYLWEEGLHIPNHPAANQPRKPEEEIVKLVRDRMYEAHCIHTGNGTPLIINAFFSNVDAPETEEEKSTQIGWCSGSMIAYPFLKFGGKYREHAVKYLDFLAENGQTPAGTKYAEYDGRIWMTKEHPRYRELYSHCRFFGDYIYYLGKAIAWEKKNGYEHPAWEEDFQKGVQAITGLWEREKDFGIYWDHESTQLKVSRAGSGAGAFPLLALTEAARHYPQDNKLKQAVLEAADVYYQRCILTGRCNGGPGDILEADDSESIAALTNAFVNVYKLYGQEKHKEMAVQAGHLFASWVLCYVPSFPGGSVLEGLNVCGGVIANVQNRHVGPGICTNSARFVYELGQMTGDSRWIEMYYRIKAAALNCVCLYTGEFFGTTFEEIFGCGMVSEQINVTDSLGDAGETWRVSAGWPAADILLAYWDDPQFD